eukprot:c43800_g1_i1 orf=96-1514(+)
MQSRLTAIMDDKEASLFRRHSPFASPIPMGSITQTQKVLTNQAHKLVKHADRHEQFLNKVTYCLGVLLFGLFCYLLGSRPQDIPRFYCLFFIFVAPLRWIYYRFKKWHYYLLDFCYYANVIFVFMLLLFPNNNKLFMLCFSFSEGPLAWALIVWRCSLVFSSIDKIISVLIHLLPGTVFFILRWWDTNTLSPEAAEEKGHFPAWPIVNSIPTLWMWLFFVPLMVYCIWQGLYFLVVEGLRRQRILRDPEIMTSYRELKRKAERANNIWWRLSGLLGAENRVYMYAIIQAVFTVATLALTVPMFKSYRLHIGFEVFKLAATVWNGGNFVFEVIPRQAAKKLKSEEEIHAEDRRPSTVYASSKHGSESSNLDGITENAACLAQPISGKCGADREQEVCALCRRQSLEILAKFTLDGLKDGVDDGEASQLLNLMSTKLKTRIPAAGRQIVHGGTANCESSSARGLEWRRQVACAS